jgi:hypothetical protein
VSLELLDLLGHVSYALLAIGMLLMARKNIWGSVFRFFGESGWLFIGVQMGMSSIWGWGIIFVCMEIYVFWSWTKKKPQS